ncbi:MAG: LPS-assembly protein LptD, partial [Myxococcales bacterium]
ISPPGEEILLRADRLIIEDEGERWRAEGNVVFRAGELTIRADAIEYDNATETIEARGSVLASDRSRELRAASLRYPWRSKTIHIESAEAALRVGEGSPPYRLRLFGARLSREADGLWRLEQGWFTPCDCGEGETPSWSLSCRAAELREGDEVMLDRPVFRIRETPVFALPEARVPLARRKTGLLAPSLGYSDRLGARYQQEFYWAIDDWSDATVGLDAMHRRGVRPTLEYRHVTERTFGVWRGFHLYDFRGDRDDTATQRFGADADFAWKPFDWLRQKTRLDLLSDARVVSDFGRDWRSRARDFTESRVQLQSDVAGFFAGVEASAAQSLIAAPADGWLWGDDRATSFYAAPSLRLALPSRPLLGGRLLIAADLAFDLFGAPPGGTAALGLATDDREPLSRLGRLAIAPRLAAPLVFGDYGSLTLGAALTHYSFFPERAEDRAAEGFVELGATADTRLYRVFDLAGGGRLKHEIVPRLTWRYVPHAYTFGAEASFERQLTTPLDQRFAPHVAGVGVLQRLALRQAGSATILRFLSLDLRQQAFIDDASAERLDARLDEGAAEMALALPKADWRGQIGVQWEDAAVGSAASRLRLGPFRGVSLDHRYRYIAPGAPLGDWLLQQRDAPEETLHQTGGGLAWTIVPAFSVRYDVDVSVAYRRLIEQMWRAEYRSPCRCWRAELTVYHRPGLTAPDVYLNVDLAPLFDAPPAAEASFGNGG